MHPTKLKAKGLLKQVLFKEIFTLIERFSSKNEKPKILTAPSQKQLNLALFKIGRLKTSLEKWAKQLSENNYPKMTSYIDVNRCLFSQLKTNQI